MNGFQFDPTLTIPGPYFSVLTGLVELYNFTTRKEYKKQILFLGEHHGECFCVKQTETPDIQYSNQGEKIVVFNENNEANKLCTPALMFHILSLNASKPFDVFIELPFEVIKNLDYSLDLSTNSSDIDSVHTLYRKCIRGNPIDCDYKNVKVHAIDYRSKHVSEKVIDLSMYNSKLIKECVYIYYNNHRRLDYYDDVFSLFHNLMKIDKPSKKTRKLIGKIINAFYQNIDIGNALDIYLFAENGYIVDLCSEFLTEKNYMILNQLGNSRFSDYKTKNQDDAFKLALVYAYTQDFLTIMNKFCQAKDRKYYSKAAKQYLKLKNTRIDITVYNTITRNLDYESVHLSIWRWFQSQKKEEFVSQFKKWKKGFLYDREDFVNTFTLTIIMDVPALCRMFYSDNDKAIFLTGAFHSRTYQSFFEFMGFDYSLKQISKPSGLEVGAETVEFLNSIMSTTFKRCKTCDKSIVTRAYKCGASASCQYMYCSKECGTQDWLAGHFNFIH